MDKVEFSEPLFFLHIMGLHPFRTDLFAKIRRIFALMVFFLVITSGFLELLLNSEGLETYARASDTMLPYSQILAKFAVFLIHRKQIGGLLKTTETFWPLDKFGVYFLKKLHKSHFYLKRFFTIYKVLLIFTCMQFVVVKVVFGEDKPISISYGESKGLTPLHQHLYLFLHASVSFLTANLVTGFDGFFFYFVGHILTEIQMVRTAFGSDVIWTGWNERKRFRQAAKHHSRVLECVKNFNDVFSIVLLLQHLSCLFGICFGLFLMSRDGFPPDLDLATKYLPYILSFVLQTFTFCFAGHLLMNWSLEIPYEIFYNGWDNTYQNLQGRVISISRGQKAAKLTLGSFGDLDLESFKMVMQKTFSFFTFVTAVMDDK